MDRNAMGDLVVAEAVILLEEEAIARRWHEIEEELRRREE